MKLACLSQIQYQNFVHFVEKKRTRGFLIVDRAVNRPLSIGHTHQSHKLDTVSKQIAWSSGYYGWLACCCPGFKSRHGSIFFLFVFRLVKISSMVL